MNILDIIAKKRDKKVLSKEEIDFFIKEYTNGIVTDYQAAALVMAIFINGMNNEEITDLTLAMAHSGDVLDLSKFGENVVDKHSTGGVGDKVTLIITPIIASLGIPVAKMSGRGLGFTGGTVDKLESIPGYNTGISIDEFIKNVEEIGISVMGQTLNLAPADKKLYALRDTISAVESIPLIASSIMSKKIAAGANKIVLDVTCGKGAFMKTKEDAILLSKTMSAIGKLAKKETVCVITNMDEPLGYAVGNSLEMIEAIECLQNKMEPDVKEVILEIGAYIIKLADKGNNLEQNKKMILENIENGKAYSKFIQLIERQGGDIEYVKDLDKFEKAEYILPVISEKDGYIKSLNAERVGRISGELGAGRIRKEDKIDMAVGIILKNKTGAHVKKGDILAYIHANNKNLGNEKVKDLLSVYEIVDEKVEKPNHIIGII